MKLIYHPLFLEHDTDWHPESADRLEAFQGLPTTEIPLNEKVLELVHPRSYIDKIKEYAVSGRSPDPETIVSAGSMKAAITAANGAILAAEQGDFVLCRPPGHHAYANYGSGFCLFNNVAIATKNLLSRNKKVLIFDFDGHFGDGTADIFYDSDKVMYFSMHQSPAFPGKGMVNEIGKDRGTGYTINMPLPPFSGDDILQDSLNTLNPVLKQFNPDVVAISAGFDAHESDPLLHLRWSTSAFHSLGKHIRKNFNNHFAVLEGGYNTEVLAECIHAFLDGINGKKFKGSDRHSDSEILVWNEYEMRLDTLINYLKPYWDI